MTLKQELEKIICERIGANEREFSIGLYLEEGWMTEEMLFEAIRILYIRRNKQ